MSIVRQGPVYGGLVLILLGLVFLAFNVGWLRFDAWGVLWRFWPLVLVAIGFWLLIKNRLVYAVVMAAVVAGVIGIALFAPQSVRDQLDIIDGQTHGGKQQSSAPLGSGTRLLVFNLDFGGGFVRVHSLTDQTQAYQALFENAGHMKEKVDQRPGQTEVTLKQQLIVDNFWHQAKDHRADVGLTGSVPVEFELDAGASKVDLDFSTLQLQRLKLDLGASSGQVKLGSKVNNLEANIDAGAAVLTLQVPPDAGVEITTDFSLGSHSFEVFGLVRAGDVYRSANFDTQAHKIRIRLDTGASSIKLERF